MFSGIEVIWRKVVILVHFGEKMKRPEVDHRPRLSIDGEGNNRSTHTLWCRLTAKRAEARLGSSRLKSQLLQELPDYH